MGVNPGCVCEGSCIGEWRVGFSCGRLVQPTHLKERADSVATVLPGKFYEYCPYFLRICFPNLKYQVTEIDLATFKPPPCPLDSPSPVRFPQWEKVTASWLRNFRGIPTIGELQTISSLCMVSLLSHDHSLSTMNIGVSWKWQTRAHGKFEGSTHFIKLCWRLNQPLMIPNLGQLAGALKAQQKALIR